MRRLPISTLRPAVSMPVTDPRITWVFACVARMPRIGAAMSAGDKAAVATWYKSGWNKWWLRRSITVTSAATLPSRVAADKRPQPASMMKMRGRETPAEGPSLGYVGPPDNAIHGTVAAIKLALIYGMRMILSIVTSFEMLLTQQRAEPPKSAANPLLTVFLTPKIPLPAGPTNRTQLIDIIYVLVEERAFSDAQMRVFPAARGNADAGRRQCAVGPPSITSPAPVIKPESSEARKTMPLAMSSGTPSRPIGCRDMAC